MKAKSRLLHLRVDDAGASPAVTPIYQTSAFSAESPYFYSRKDNPNVSEFEQSVALLENARHGIAFSCGMAAIYGTLDLVRPGETVVMNKLIYGCTYKLFQRLSERRGFRLCILDLSEDYGIAAIPPSVKMVFFETPTNPFLRTVPIRRVAEAAKQRNPEALVVVDNTRATPLFQHPLEHGADLSLHSGTKYFSGHSDVMSGMALTNRDDLHAELAKVRFYGGLILSPFDAWLARRSLQTFDLRLRQHQEITLHMKEFLEAQPQVRRVYYPHVADGQLTGYGGIVFFEFRDDLAEQYVPFRDALELFGTGTGMACVTSMVAQPFTGSHASMTPEEKAGMGLGTNLVRLCFGLEDEEDLKDDLTQALRSIGSGV